MGTKIPGCSRPIAGPCICNSTSTDLHPWIHPTRDCVGTYVFIGKKNPHVNGRVQLKPMFKGQLYLNNILQTERLWLDLNERFPVGYHSVTVFLGVKPSESVSPALSLFCNVPLLRPPQVFSFTLV